MNAITIILAIYVALDIISGIIIYAILRLNGWSRYELARRFRDLLREPADDFLEGIADEFHNDFVHYEDGIEVR